MAKGINLISKEGKERVRLAKLQTKIRKFLYFILGIFLALVVVVFGLFLFFNQSINNNEKKISSLKIQIEKFYKVESLLTTTLNRSKAIGEILKDRKSYTEILTICSTLFVPGFVPQTLDIRSPDELRISGTCDSLQSLTNFNERLEEIRAKNTFSEILYPQVSRTFDGKYFLTLLLKK